MDELLRRRATPSKAVLVTAFNFGFREYMANFVCNLAKLSIGHYVMAALDSQAYEWGVVRGLPVFFFPTRHRLVAAMTYGTDEYKQVVKMKSVIVTKILEHGYSVFFVDPDVVLFRDPLANLKASPNVMYIQSDKRWRQVIYVGMWLASGAVSCATGEGSGETAMRCIHNVRCHQHGRGHCP